MVRISNIFKKAKEKAEKQTKEKVPQEGLTPPAPTPPAPPEEIKDKENKDEKSTPRITPLLTKTNQAAAGKETIKFYEQREEKKSEHAALRISPVVLKATQETAPPNENIKLYEETVSNLAGFLGKIKENPNYKVTEISEIRNYAEGIVNELLRNNEKILASAFNVSYPPADYLPYHLVNVCVYSIEVGIGLGYERPKLIDLGTLSLLYDATLIRYSDIFTQPRKLTIDEYANIRNHTTDAQEIFVNLNNDFAKLLIEVTRQHHERLDGSGYPPGLKTEAINEYAKIIGLLDMHEAMLHPRPWRDRRAPLEAMKEILENKQAFEYKIIKTLIERAGIFPVGSPVKLNTKEIARVVKLNPKVCLRPVVEIISYPDGLEPKEIKALDLTTQPTIYISSS